MSDEQPPQPPQPPQSPQSPLPPPCPPPSKFVHGHAKRFPKEQAEKAGEAVLAGIRNNPLLSGFRSESEHPSHHHRGLPKQQPLSRSNAAASLTPSEEAQFASFEVALGGRQQLAALLAAADVPARDLHLAAMLVDPANDNTSLAQLCAFSRVSLRRLLDFVKDAALIRGQVHALVAVGERLPEVAAGLMADAIPSDRTCPVCRGLRQLLDDPTPQNPSPVPRICKTCDGTGTVPYRPETELRKVALQIGKLLDKPGGTNNVFVATKFGEGTAPSFNSSVMELDQALDGKNRDRFGRRIVESESTSPESDEPPSEEA